MGRRDLCRADRVARPRLADAGAKGHQPSRACRRNFPPGKSRPAKRVVLDGKLITSLAAGSAMEFAYEIVRQLRGPDAVSKVNQGVCAVV